MKQTHSSKASGFTLVELLLYISVSASIILVVTFFLAMLWQSKIKNQTISEVEQQGMFIIRQIRQSIKKSSSIISPIPGESSQSLNLNTTSSSTSPIILILENGAVKVSEAGGEQYSLSGNNIIVSNLEFTNLSRSNTPGIIQISFTVSYNSTSLQKEYEHQINFYDSISIRK